MTETLRRLLRCASSLEFFVLFGEYKVFGTDFTLRGGFEEWIRSFLAQGVYPWMKPVLESIILPHARVCGFLTAYGELMIGLGLVAGVLTRTASEVRHHVDGAPAGFSRLPRAACRPMALLWRLAPVVRFYRVFCCIHHRRTRSAVVAPAAPSPLVLTVAWRALV